MVTTPRCAPRRLGGAHSFFPVVNTPNKTLNRVATLATGVPRHGPAPSLEERANGCSALRLFAIGAGMAGVGAVSLVEEQAVVSFVSPPGRGGRPPGGGRGKRSGQDRRTTTTAMPRSAKPGKPKQQPNKMLQRWWCRCPRRRRGGRFVAGVGEGSALVQEEGGQPRVGGDRRVGVRGGQRDAAHSGRALCEYVNGQSRGGHRQRWRRCWNRRGRSVDI